MTPTERQARYDAAKAEARRVRDYRSFVGPADRYDLVAANQFCLLHLLGLRERHFVLDVGCGSLRAGRLLIPYLLPDRYFGIEPEEWLLEAGLRAELGQDILRAKRPVLRVDSEFAFERLGGRFDFILIHSIFSHASPDQVRQCLGQTRRVMNPDATVAATFIPGATDYVGDRWAYSATYTWPRIHQFAAEHGLVCTPIPWPHPTGQTWCVLLEMGNQAGLEACRRLAAWAASATDAFRDTRPAPIDKHPHGKAGPPAWRAVRAVLRRWTRSAP